MFGIRESVAAFGVGGGSSLCRARNQERPGGVPCLLRGESLPCPRHGPPFGLRVFIWISFKWKGAPELYDRRAPRVKIFYADAHAGAPDALLARAALRPHPGGRIFVLSPARMV
jgi:hypothetical protein